ncbi:hypothetical protein INR49_026109 [Caranx melampygus]|nr:hypothetical protein INR49_026109 [Caranx melampygus]
MGLRALIDQHLAKKACAGLGLKVLRKEDEEKNTFPVPLRRSDSLGLMTSPGFIMNELFMR